MALIPPFLAMASLKSYRLWALLIRLHERELILTGLGVLKNRCYVKIFTYDVIYFTYDVIFFT